MVLSSCAGRWEPSCEFTYVEDVVEATIAAGFIDEAQNALLTLEEVQLLSMK